MKSKHKVPPLPRCSLQLVAAGKRKICCLQCLSDISTTTLGRPHAQEKLAIRKWFPYVCALLCLGVFCLARSFRFFVLYYIVFDRERHEVVWVWRWREYGRSWGKGRDMIEIHCLKQLNKEKAIRSYQLKFKITIFNIHSYHNSGRARLEGHFSL